jgi:hypothetical protein
MKDPLGLFLGHWGDNSPCSFGPTVLIDGFDFFRGWCVGAFIPLPFPRGIDSDPIERALCSEQDFSFAQGSGGFSAGELSAIAQVAVGEAGYLAYNFNEISAVIATVFNRRYINLEYLRNGSQRGPFNPGGTSIIPILESGYDAHRRRSGENKLAQAKRLSGGVLYEGDYVCDQLKAAKALTRVYADFPSQALFEIAPYTHNHTDRNAVPTDALNIVRYGGNWFWLENLQDNR